MERAVHRLCRDPDSRWPTRVVQDDSAGGSHQLSALSRDGLPARASQSEVRSLQWTGTTAETERWSPSSAGPWRTGIMSCRPCLGEACRPWRRAGF